MKIQQQNLTQLTQLSSLESKNTLTGMASKLAKKITSLAVPIIALTALASLPTADSGPVTYWLCVAGCEGLATVSTAGTGSAVAIQACIWACMPLFACPATP